MCITYKQKLSWSEYREIKTKKRTERIRTIQRRQTRNKRRYQAWVDKEVKMSGFVNWKLM
jgi:hypothetical protein